MKKLCKIFLTALTVLILTPELKASHNAGGDIQYQYISSTSGTHNYKIIMRLYRDLTGITLPSSATVYACSSNYSTISTNLSEVGSTSGAGVVAPTFFDCVSSTLAGVTINVAYYEGEITLPGNAPDWTFAFSTCCRNPAVDNITNPSSQGFYIEAKLNNQIGQNTSPEFVSEPVRAFCIGRTFNWKQGAVEPDGDSLYFRMSYVKDGSAGTCSSPSNLSYATGWTYDQPISTSATDSLSIDHATGIITFKPSTVEIDVMAVIVDEYRLDTTLNVWQKIGEINRDMQIAIATACTPLAQSGVQLDIQAPGFSIDSITGIPHIEVNCWSDSAFAFPFSFKLDCSTIAADGSDFAVYNSSGALLSFDSVYIMCDVNNEAFDLAIYSDTTFYNGSYYIVYQQGSDSNVVTNKCGFGPEHGDTLCSVDVNLPIVGAILGVQQGIDTSSIYNYTTLLNSSDSTFWTISNGVILSGQGTDTVSVKWSGPSNGSLSAWRNSALGCGDTAHMIIQTNISVSEIDLKNEIKLYPNPNKGSATLELGELKVERIEVYDSRGKCILLENQPQRKTVLNLNKVPNGLYLVNIYTKNGELLDVRLVKQ